RRADAHRHAGVADTARGGAGAGLCARRRRKRLRAAHGRGADLRCRRPAARRPQPHDPREPHGRAIVLRRRTPARAATDAGADRRRALLAWRDLNREGRPMTVVRLIADDLTGALDTAAEFVAACGPIPVCTADAVPADAGASLSGASLSGASLSGASL